MSFVYVWLVLCFMFAYYSNNLLLSLLLLEVTSFFLLFIFVAFSGFYVSLDFVVVVLFSLFVIEGVLALAGLVLLVSFTGSDYVSSYSFINS